MRELVGRAMDHAGRLLLFAADLERGAGQQLAEATPLPPPAALAQLDDDRLIAAARITAQEAAAARIGWVLAPVADLDVEPENPIVGTRSFGSRPASVSDRVRTWVMAAQIEGVHACAKHFPGHGRTIADSHAELPVVGADREELEADLAPFRAAIEAGVRSVMMAHVSYTALDPSGAPASLSPRIVGLLRDGLGFAGIVATDALIMEAVAASGRTEAQAAVEAIRAGCDVLLYPRSTEASVAALRSSVDSGEVDRERVSQAAARVAAAAESAEIAVDDLIPVSSYARALQIAAASVAPLRGPVPRLAPGTSVRVHVVDDDVVSLPPSVAAPGTQARDRGRLAAALASRGLHVTAESSGEQGANLVAVFSEVRAWKGRSGLAAATVSEADRIVGQVPDATLIVFGHPRLAEQLPAAATVVCGWCGDPLMQEAVAERLVASGG